MEKNPIKTLLTNPSNYSYEGYMSCGQMCIQ